MKGMEKMSAAFMEGVADDYDEVMVYRMKHWGGCHIHAGHMMMMRRRGKRKTKKRRSVFCFCCRFWLRLWLEFGGLLWSRSSSRYP